MGVKVGDWVRSYGTGIWQVYRVLDNFYDLDPVNGAIKQRTLIFSKRFISDSFKRSFKSECCHPSYVYHLEETDKTKLDEFIENNPETFKKFVNYLTKPIDSIYSARIGVPDQGTLEEVESKFNKKTELSVLEINKTLEELGFDLNAFPHWTVQFVSEDHSCIDNHLIYKFNRILDF